ncbi:MAG TPA: RNA-directed DNA polymerase [Actinomycetota bacterium]|nr:RNA-directed DNA polymerase [Actinomycetota bacterium]
MSSNRTLAQCTRLVGSPKRGGGIRWLSLLDHPSEARYSALVASVAPAIEASLGPEVVANRAALGTSSTGLPLRPWRPAWKAFLRWGHHLALGAEAFVAADVRRCYPSIGPDLVGRTLLRLGCARDDVRGVTTILEAFAASGASGLPIGPNPSAVLANAVLAGGDEALRSAGVLHLRWVDDVWIFAPGRPEALTALGSLARWLEGQGLSLAPEKTRILDRPHEIAAAVGGGTVSPATPRYHRRSDAHALPGVNGPHPVAPSERGVDPDRRTPRAARRIG